VAADRRGRWWWFIVDAEDNRFGGCESTVIPLIRFAIDGYKPVVFVGYLRLVYLVFVITLVQAGDQKASIAVGALARSSLKTRSAIQLVAVRAEELKFGVFSSRFG
jgi:hypothetical protein